jgi:outer membrane protein OmpA-like peptidoglycan-associated protein
MLLFSKADVRYEGHTDRVGDDDYNQWLSEQRALSVYRYFLEESLPRQTEPAAKEQIQNRLQTVQQLLAMKYAPAGRNAARTETFSLLGDAVIGKGEREPVEDVPGQSERNRRVVLLFPPAQVGQVTSLCEAPTNR